MARFPTYTWVPSSARYHSQRTGRFASTTAVRNALFQAADAEMQRAKVLAEQYRKGEIGTAEFRLTMREVIKNTQLFGEAAARGGWAQMDGASVALVEQRVRVQYAFLDGFVADLEQGKLMSVDRAAQYVKASKSAYTETRGQVVQIAGFDEIASDLHPAEHCPDCVFEAARGFVKIGTEVPLGQRQCLSNDRCTVRFRNSQTGEELAA
jgi:hypothetical protein